ncbi:Riboflavin synthase [Candidatus Entotheonellaceae bacterium PAL068K]
MFTGIVEYVGTVRSVARQGALVQFAIACGPVAAGVRLGESIGINGTDLTITAIEGTPLHFDMVQETAGLTNLGALRRGSRVTLERALAASGRYDGHIVQGRIDGTGVIRELRRQQQDVRMFVSCGPEMIPWTLAPTTLGERRVGNVVNLEVDLIGKYVYKYRHQMFSGRPDPARPGSLSIEKLRALGF